MPRLQLVLNLLVLLALAAACAPAPAPSPTAAPAKPAESQAPKASAPGGPAEAAKPTAAPAKPAEAAKPADAKPAAAAASPPSASGGPAAKAKPLGKVKFAQALEGLDFIPLYVARKQGYFEQEGLEVEVISMSGGGGPNVQALLAGEVQFTMSSVSVVLGPVRQGQEVLFVQPVLDKLIVNFVMHEAVAKERGVTASMPLAEKYKALKGLTIGITRPGALTDQVAQYIVRRAGFTPQQDVKLVGVGTAGAALAALDQRKVEVIAHTSPIPEQAVRQNIGVMLFNNSAGEVPELRDYLGLGLVTTPKYARANPDVVRAFTRAIDRAVRYVVDNPPEETAKIVDSFMPGMDMGVLAESIKNTRPGFVPGAKLKESSIMVPQRILVEIGAEKDVIDWTKFSTNEFLGP